MHVNAPKVSSPKEAEARAIIFMLKGGSLWGFHKIYLLSDAFEAVEL